MPLELEQAVQYIRSRSALRPRIGIILGSGLGALIDGVKSPDLIPAREIPHYPLPAVTGHTGSIILGLVQGIPLFIVQGRTHYYEGYTVEKVTFVVRIMAALGIKVLIITCAAGAVNTRLQPGDVMLITDHINLMFVNPLRGPLRYGGERFPDMSEPYNVKYFKLVENIARANKIGLQRGILCAVAGPCYETAAEVRMIAGLGADAVSMSTVPEVLVARQAGLEVIGLACITNLATGISYEKLSHDDVVRVAGEANAKFLKLIRGIINKLYRY
jgi:purine-nucleoside phosphorylase